MADRLRQFDSAAARLTPSIWRNTRGEACDRSSRANRAGFTLLELLVVLTILMVAAAAIMPNVVAYERSQQVKSIEAAIYRLPIQAKDEAAKSQEPVRISIDGSSLVMERVPVDSNGVEQPQVVKELQLGDNVQIENSQMANTSNSQGNWEWNTYPDGSSDDCGIQFSIDSQDKSLLLPARGNPQWTDGALPDLTQDRWQAGQLAVRSSTTSTSTTTQ